MTRLGFVFFVWLLALAASPLQAKELEYDFRVVIDVSGSMKQTDPQNLRVPALKLINGLIPAGSRAGVWTFGRYVNMSVKWGKVDEKWRKRADQGADEIHSNALLTNIESALTRASVGWDKPDPSTRRVLLLLTDGQVDVSKNAEKNAASRDRVLSQSLKKLKAAAVQVHSIALSGETDEVLLKQLALETNGSFAIAESADQLQKVFFKMFARASQPDTVAFDGNEFSIDSSIREMTLLIFRDEKSQPAILIPPDSAAISAAKPRKSRWRSDIGYDLITIKNPEKGVWRIDADMDPDNRLMVVTDLTLEVDGIPAYSAPGKSIPVIAELANRGKKIKKNSFLRFVDFNMTHIDPDG
ncbi:MAG: vWA domain-containing protein, partial [Pseudomonadota bacterium]